MVTTIANEVVGYEERRRGMIGMMRNAR